MPTKERTMRMDFVIKEPHIDEKTGRFTFILIPDPKRYEFKEIGGKKGYLDKFDKVFFSEETLKKMSSQTIGKPLYCSPPKNEDMKQFYLSRIDEIKSFLEDGSEGYKFYDKSEEFLSKLQKQEQRKYVILAIDLKDSTKMSQELDEKDNAKIISLFSREMAVITNNFNGFVLKYMGDGLICYFPEPNFVGMNDNAINCALIMKNFILTCLNPLLKKYNLPELRFRIGLDSGEAVMVVVGDKSIKEHTDLIGLTISLATKVQGLAGENEVFLGESTALNVHTYWREKIKKIDLSEKWNYVDKKTGKPYNVYKLVL